MNSTRVLKTVWLALILRLSASLLQADSVTVTITVDNGYGFGYGDSNGIYAGQYYGGIDNCYSSQIFGSPCYVFVSPDNPQGATDTGAEIYNITAGSNDYIYIVAWSDDSSLQGAVAAFTDNTTATTVTTSPAWPWQVFATGTNWAPNCNSTGAHGPPLTGFPYAISNQIAVANASAGGPGSSVTWVNNTGGPNGRLDFSGQYNGNAYYYAPPACIASGALWMEYNPDPGNPACNPFVWGSVPGYGSIPNFLREYLIYRIGPLGQLASSNCLQAQCPTNKAVPCGTNWTFDWPTASSCCTNDFLTAAGTLTNLLIISTGAVTNGACPLVTITQSWQISDGCGDSTNCSQTVTVTGCCTNCLQVQCPNTKTVLCGSDWAFDQPIVTSCCTNEIGLGTTSETNVIITSTGIVTNGSCPQVAITQTWQITDACGDSTNCSQTVVVLGCCNGCATECCGPNLGPQTIQWLQLPTNVFFHRNPLGDNKSNTWIITNLPCYGNVLVTEDPPTNVLAVSSNGDFGAAHAISSFAFAPNTNGMFNFTQSVPGTYGPYSWGATPGAVELGYRFPYTNAFGQTAPLPSYNVTFYFLDGQPNPCSLIFSAIGLAQSTTNIVSQPLTFRTEYDLSNNPVNYPTGPSADTVLNNTYGPSLASNVSGTVISSAYDFNGGDDFNTGWAIFQPTGILLTTNLPPGSGTDINGNPYPASNTYPYLQVIINQELDDDFSVTVGYICCPSCGSNCFQTQCPTNKTVQCGTTWSFDPPTATSCCPAVFGAGPAGPGTNVLITPVGFVTNGSCPLEDITETWLITDGCGDTNYCSQTVTVLGCCTNSCIELTCPSDIVVTTCSNCADVFYSAMATNSCCFSNVALIYNPPSGSCFPLGTNTVQVTAYDPDCASTPPAMCSFTVTVLPGTNCSSNCLTVLCPTNKTVQCGSAWMFDLPTATSCCSNEFGSTSGGGAETNVLIFSTGIVTNSVCPTLSVTENWLIEDGCGDATNCSQTVTVEGTLPPVINCPSNMVIAVTNCTTNVLVCYTPTAFDPCSGSNLTVTCSPPSCSYFAPGTTTTVNCVVTNCNGLTNSCNFTVMIECCTEPLCCGPGLGKQTINWLNLPTNGGIVLDPSGTNPQGSWYMTNMGCYGNVLVTQDCPSPPTGNVPDPVYWFANPNLMNAPNGNGSFVDLETGYGPYSWAIGGCLDLYNSAPTNISYTVNFYFLDGAPNPCSLVVSTIGLGENTTATVSQSVTFRGEYDLNAPLSDGTYSARTTLNGALPLPSGSSGTLVGSAFGPPLNDGGDQVNTGWALLQPNNSLPTTNLAAGSVQGYAGPLTGLSYISLLVNHEPGDGIGFTVGYICCTNCSNNCLQVQCPSDKTVKCGSDWTFDMPTAASCCTNFYDAPPGQTPTNVLILPGIPVTNGSCPMVTITQTWTISDLCGDSTNCSQVVTVEGCCTNCLELQCPSNIVVTTCSNCAQVFYSATATACCTNVTELVYDPPSGTCFPIGTTNVQVSAYACGYVTNCEFTVTVLPCQSNSNICSNGCLTISTPANIVVYSCTNVPVFYNPTALDTCCNGNLSLTCTPASGSYFAPGTTTTVTCAVLDFCGLSNNCQFTVTVICTNCLLVDCPTNKTVECGTKWAFDLPTATSCCATNVKGAKTNVSIITTSTVTNGVCPQFITNTWLITDGCGNTNTCSQTVEVVDTTPPFINCPSNAYFEQLNSNCDLVIPKITVTATDNCTPPCDLVYSQSPAAGTIVIGHDAYVTLTVTDLCGNSNSCVVEVIGEPVAGLSVDWPTNVTVTNCVVPCVHVTATDCACPLMIPKVTQSPPCDTPLGPGVNSVTVTVTDCMGATATKVIPLIIVGEESFLGALTNTGISVTGALQPNGTVDPHYFAGPVSGPPSGYIAPDAVVITNQWAWLEVTHVSQWIAPTIFADLANCPGGNFTYTNQFTLPVGANPASASISGRWAADNGAVQMKINGHITGNTVAVPIGFKYWTPFTINSGFVPGLNTILFVVTNQGASPSGLRVEYTNANVFCSNCAPPNIISITGSQSLQEGSTATFTVKAGGTPPLSYQWQFNENDIDGATNSVLQLPSIGYTNAGLYTVNISNPCGGGTGGETGGGTGGASSATTGQISLQVTPALPWPNASWNVANLSNPLRATFGPDLVLVGTDAATNFSLSDGTTEDFGLPDPGGQIVNVMDINPLDGATIELPVVAASGSTSDNCYTLIMDIYEPDTSLGTPSTLYESIPCCVSNLGSGGQDGVGLTLDASNNLHITGSTGGTPFDYPADVPMPVDVWNRVALVVDQPQDGIAANMIAYLNGGPVININPCPCCVIAFTNINWITGSPTVLTAPTTAVSPNAEFYVSSIQFHAIALNSQSIAGIGSPAGGPAPMNRTSVGPSPVLSATLENGAVNISWSGSPYKLQESTDLGSGVWADSELPFTETAGTTGNIVTAAVVSPTPSAPGKFYRLIFSP
jgi:hypothetical protein